jgi:ATP-dependent exoDNAse (exonuclease V) beta subunit
MAGLLRSPALGLKDSTLFRLRWGPEGSRSLLEALSQELDTIHEEERARIERARQIIDGLLPLVDRLPIAELLKLVVDKLDYRAVLATGHSRLWRNLDKLLVDAHDSGAVQVRAFLEYLRTLRDVGVREGEAPATPEGAIRLMTIHKAKGLEFDFVVIADASWRPRSFHAPVYLLEETGPALKLDRFDVSPLIFRLAKAIDTRQSQAEGSRLLYVAATRTKEKLLVSGHLSATRGGLSTAGWMKSLLEAMEVDPKKLSDEPSPREVALPGGEPVRIWVALEDLLPEAWEMEDALEWPTSKLLPLFDPLAAADDDDTDPKADEKPLPDWRATGDRLHAPAVAVGNMVHAAIQAWLFPDDSRLEALLSTAALEEGLVDPGQRKRAITQSNKLLRRLLNHPLHSEIEAAAQRSHEVPYTLELADGRPGSGVIDLLYRSQDTWKIIDFKTDNLDSQDDIEQAMVEYRPQVTRYVEAVNRLLRVQANASICFLDAMGKVAVKDV